MDRRTGSGPAELLLRLPAEEAVGRLLRLFPGSRSRIGSGGPPAVWRQAGCLPGSGLRSLPGLPCLSSLPTGALLSVQRTHRLLSVEAPAFRQSGQSSDQSGYLHPGRLLRRHIGPDQGTAYRIPGHRHRRRLGFRLVPLPALWPHPSSYPGSDHPPSGGPGHPGSAEALAGA